MTPRPGVSEPHVRDDMEWSWLWTSIVGCDSEQELFRVIRLFCTLNEDVKIAIVLKRVGVNDVELVLVFASLCVF